MTVSIEKSDRPLIETLRSQGSQSVEQIGQALGVTATAVRQRLDRLLAGKVIERMEVRRGVGRPSYVYQLTDEGQLALGNNLNDLARVLWAEIKNIPDRDVRQALLNRITERFADAYAEEVTGESIGERIESLARCLRERNVVVTVENAPGNPLPILKLNGCPYPGLASVDGHEICHVEQNLFSNLLGQTVELTECRCHSVEGNCTFAVRPERS